MRRPHAPPHKPTCPRTAPKSDVIASRPRRRGDPAPSNRMKPRPTRTHGEGPAHRQKPPHRSDSPLQTDVPTHRPTKRRHREPPPAAWRSSTVQQDETPPSPHTTRRPRPSSQAAAPIRFGPTTQRHRAPPHNATSPRTAPQSDVIASRPRRRGDPAPSNKMKPRRTHTRGEGPAHRQKPPRPSDSAKRERRTTLTPSWRSG